MRIVGRKAFRVIYFYLMTAGLPVLLMHLAMENERLCALAYLCAILLAFPISLLPGKIAKEKIPLRMPVAFAAAGAVIAAAIAFAIHCELFFLRGIFAGIIMALLMIFAVREAALEYGQWTSTQGASIGLVLYLFAGAATASLVEAPRYESREQAEDAFALFKSRADNFGILGCILHNQVASFLGGCKSCIQLFAGFDDQFFFSHFFCLLFYFYCFICFIRFINIEGDSPQQTPFWSTILP